MLISIDSLVELLSQKVQERDSEIVARRGSMIHDGFIIPSATSLAWNSALLEFTKAQTALDTILQAKTNATLITSVAEALNLSTDATVQLLSTAIDRMASNFGLSRKTARKASGLVYFYVRTAPVTDLTVPAGTMVETAQKVQFVTTTAVTLSVSTLSAFFDPALNAYSVAVPVEAILSGPNSNVAANTIVYSAGVMPVGFSGVTNKYAISNGYLEETDEEFVARIKTTLRGQNLETKDGIAALILNNTTVRSVLVVDAQSPYQFRNKGKGGVVDIYTLDTIPAVVTDTPTYTGDYTMVHQPVLDILSVIGPTGPSDPTHEFVEGTDFELVVDTNILTRGSARAATKIRWLPGGQTPAGTYEVQYIYNQAVEAIQDLVTSDSYRPLMGDVTSAVLAREGIRVDVEISYQVIIHGGYSRSQVINNIVSNLQGYINGLGFGQDLAQSDVVNVIENTPGVNYVYTTPLAFNRVGHPIQDVIETQAFEYLRASAITIL